MTQGRPRALVDYVSSAASLHLPSSVLFVRAGSTSSASEKSTYWYGERQRGSGRVLYGLLTVASWPHPADRRVELALEPERSPRLVLFWQQCCILSTRIFQLYGNKSYLITDSESCTRPVKLPAHRVSSCHSQRPLCDQPTSSDALGARPHGLPPGFGLSALPLPYRASRVSVEPVQVTSPIPLAPGA